MISIEDARETLFADFLMEQEPGYGDWLFGKVTRTMGLVADGTAKLTEHSAAMKAMKDRLRVKPLPGSPRQSSGASSEK